MSTDVPHDVAVLGLGRVTYPEHNDAAEGSDNGNLAVARQGPNGLLAQYPRQRQRLISLFVALCLALLTWVETRFEIPNDQGKEVLGGIKMAPNVAKLEDDYVIFALMHEAARSTQRLRRHNEKGVYAHSAKLLRSSARASAQKYIYKNAARYNLGHYIRRQAAGFISTSRSLIDAVRRRKAGARGPQRNRQQQRKEQARVKAAALIERERERAARELYGWLTWPIMAPIWLFALLALTAWMGLMLEQRTLPAVRVLCAILRIPDDVAGATVLAVCTGGFEVLFSAVETLEGDIGIGLDFVLGSGVVNFGLILPIIVFVSRRTVDLDLEPIVRDGGFALLAFVALLVVISDGEVSLLDSLTLLSLYACHVLACVARLALCSGGIIASPLPHREKRQATSTLLGDAGSVDLSEAPTHSSAYQCLAVALKGAHLFLPPPPGLPYSDTLKKAPPRKHSVAAACGAVAPTLLVSALCFSFLLLALTRLADLLALSARLPFGFSASVFLPIVYALPDLLVAATVASHGQAKTAVANALGVQVVTVLLGVGLPFLLATLSNRGKRVAIFGSDSDVSL